MAIAKTTTTAAKTPTRRAAKKAATKTAAKPETAAKPRSKARKTVKIAPKSAALPEIAEASAAAAAKTGALSKRGLIGAVAERSGVKRSDAKSAVEMALKVLGEAIADGRELNLPGLGKVKVMRTKKQANAHVYVTKVRQPIETAAPAPGIDPDLTDDSGPETGGETPPKDPLAEAAE